MTALRTLQSVQVVYLNLDMIECLNNLHKFVELPGWSTMSGDGQFREEASSMGHDGRKASSANYH